MGQTSLQILNRTGSRSFWNSSWDSKYLYQDFFFKFMLFERIIHTIINRKSYSSGVLNLTSKTLNNIYIFKNFKELVNIDDEDYDIYNENICKSKLWVFKYHNWVVLSVFILMPYKQHKLVKKKSTLTEPYVKKKLFSIISLKKKNVLKLKSLNSLRNRTAKSATKLKKRSNLKQSYNKKMKKIKKKRKLNLNKVTHFKFNLTIYKKNKNWAKNSGSIKNIKNIKIKKLIPLKLYKDNLKTIVMSYKRKLKDPYDLTKGVKSMRSVARLKIKGKKTDNLLKKPFRLYLKRRKKELTYEMFLKDKYTLPKIISTVRSRTSPKIDFLRKCILFKWNFLDYKKKEFKVTLKRLLRSKPLKKILLDIKSFNKTNKVLSYKNSYFNNNFLNKNILIKKKLLKKQILFFKMNKKLNKKLNKKNVFEKSFFFHLSALPKFNLSKIKLAKFNLRKKKFKLKKIHNILAKINNEAKESKALINKTISIKNLYNYL